MDFYFNGLNDAVDILKWLYEDDLLRCSLRGNSMISPSKASIMGDMKKVSVFTASDSEHRYDFGCVTNRFKVTQGKMFVQMEVFVCLLKKILWEE